MGVCASRNFPLFSNIQTKLLISAVGDIDIQSVLEKNDYLKSTDNDDKKEEPIYEELFIHEILCGKPESKFSGLLPLIRHFMEFQDYSDSHKE